MKCKDCGSEAYFVTTYGVVTCCVCRGHNVKEVFDMKLDIDRDLSRLDDKKLSKRRIVCCEYHDEPLNRHGECETCAASEEKAKVEFADPGGSGKPDSHRMLEAWKLKR